MSALLLVFETCRKMSDSKFPYRKLQFYIDKKRTK